MSLLIPVWYVSNPVGHALVDDDLVGLDGTLQWRLDIPKTLRRSVQGRRDVLTALLREDVKSLGRCHPYAWVTAKIPLRLSRVALRPFLVPVINEIIEAGVTNETLRVVQKVQQEIREVVFLNGIRTDCQRSNLREVL